MKKIKELKMYISLKQQIETDIANKKYNHLNDQLFKFVFGKEERKGITIAFLNAALEREGENEIKDITFANTEFSPLAEQEKSGRLDVYCVTNNGEKVDVEVQINNKGNIEKRTLFYWANMYLIGFTHGHNYKELKPAITINLLNYTNFSKAPVHSVYSVYNKDTNEKLNNDLELHFFEINKFQKKPIEEMTRIERWLAYFSNKLNAKELEELGMKEPMIQNAMNASDTFMNDISERLAYLNREMALSDEVTNRESAMEKGIEIGHEKGLAEGIEKGLAEGIEKGLAEGIEKGLAEGQLKTRIEMIYAMMADGLEDERISRITKEPLEEVTRIRNKFIKQKK